MNNDKQDTFPEHMIEYGSKCIFIKNLFWSRIRNGVKFSNIVDSSIILDIGCNTGHLLRTIRENNKQCECWGIDIEPKILTLKIENCKFKISDARTIPFPDNYFTIVFALDTLEHVEDVQKAIDEIYRVLKPNGSVILSGPTETWFYRFCRLLSFQTFEKNTICDKPGFRRNTDHHFYTVYELENMFLSHNFKRIKTMSLPRFMPELFRITRFEKA